MPAPSRDEQVWPLFSAIHLLLPNAASVTAKRICPAVSECRLKYDGDTESVDHDIAEPLHVKTLASRVTVSTLHLP